MAKDILQNRLCSNQDVFSTDGRYMDNFVRTTKVFDNLIDEIIREYGKWKSQTYILFVNDLDNNILKLFLPHVLDSAELDDLEENPTLTNSYINEKRDYIQKCIDSRCFDVFKEDMEEMGHHLRQDTNTGESYLSEY